MLIEATSGAGRDEKGSESIADAAAAAEAYFWGSGAGGSGSTVEGFVATTPWALEPGLGGSGAILGRGDAFAVDDPLAGSSALALSSVVFLTDFLSVHLFKEVFQLIL